VPDFESPVSRAGSPGTGELLLVDISATTKLLVRSDEEQFGLRYGSSASFGDALISGSRPGEWQIFGTAEACAAAATRVLTGGFISIIDHTHSRALFRLSGMRAASALEKVCNIDWADEMTPNGATLSASVAKVICDIVRDDAPNQPSYLIACDRSFGQYLFDALADACSEFDPRIRPRIEDARSPI